MKPYQFLYLLVVTLLLTPSAQATEIIWATKWGYGLNGGTSRAYKSVHDPMEKYLEVFVGHSRNGEQRLYIENSREEGNDCERYPPLTSSTLIFNGQAVKMTKFCKEYADTNETYSSYTPQTERGHNYVVNLFKTATTAIELKINNDTLYIPVMGFTKIWNSAGGDAI